jgi:hypothetical protein
MATVVYGGVTVTYGGVTVVYGGADAGGEPPPAPTPRRGGGGFPRNQTTLPHRIRRLSELDEKRVEAPEPDAPPAPGALEKAAEPVFGPPVPPIAPEALKAAQRQLEATEKAIAQMARLQDDEDAALLLMTG